MQFKVQKNDPFEKAYSYGVYLLGIKLRTTGELRNRMRQKGFAPELVEKVVQQLLDLKYLNDESYAAVYLENLKKYKHFGFYGIKKKLQEKHLPNELIEEALKQGLDEATEVKQAKIFLAKQKSGMERQKLASRLASRGFRSSVIAQVLK